MENRILAYPEDWEAFKNELNFSDDSENTEAFAKAYIFALMMY